MSGSRPEPGSWEEFVAAGAGSLTAAQVAALAAADAREAGDGWVPDPEDAMPAELAALSARELAELCAASPSRLAGVARPGGPVWPLSYQAAGWPGGEPPVEGLFARGGCGDGLGFGQGGVLDSAPASLALAGFAEHACARLGDLDDDCLVGVLRAYRRLTSHMQARELALVAELGRRRPEPGTPPGRDGELPVRLSEFLAGEIAPALTLTPRAADAEVGLALDLAARPATAAALERGDIDLAKARILLDLLGPLDPGHADAVEADVLPRAGDMTTGQLRAALARAILAVDPQAARRRREQAEKQARVEYWSDPEGTASLAGRWLPPAQVLAADRRLSVIAAGWKKLGATGGMDLLRAHAYLALLLGLDPAVPPASLLPDVPAPAGSPAGHPAGGDPGSGQHGAASGPEHREGIPGQHGGPVPAGLRRPATDGLPPLAGQVNLTVPLRTLLGLADAPGEAAGYGPLHADTCRALAEAMTGHPATRWGVIITDPHGRAMGFGGPARARPAARPATGHAPARGSPAPGPARGSPPEGTAGGWTITLSTEPIAPYR